MQFASHSFSGKLSVIVAGRLDTIRRRFDAPIHTAPDNQRYRKQQPCLKIKPAIYSSEPFSIKVHGAVARRSISLSTALGRRKQARPRGAKQAPAGHHMLTSTK
ncbi:hypothetical protein OEZ86_007267 [Tetradesmus obliquus]|nr:hypothetical protein OEZ86_007267 [Tetradesmus obliquus]